MPETTSPTTNLKPANSRYDRGTGGEQVNFNNGDNFDLVELSEKFDGYSAEIMINGSVLAKADFIEDDDPHQIESRRLSGLSAHEKIELRCRRS